ncbi:hypothetical protein AALM74_04690 [Parabacteroides segnis]|uniref:hypothetical protein n=1 Tax=Parabacteroides segnis TaxID=2763058 RepID=UPI0035115516
MLKTAVYGIEYLKLAAAIEAGENAGTYPDFDTVANVFKVTAIPKDSFSHNDQAPGDNDIEVEDMATLYASIPSDAGSEGFTVQTYDMGENAYKSLMGYTKNGEWNEETVGFQLPNQAVELKTKAFQDFPSRIFQWARMKVKVTKTGTVGKSGFPNFNLEFKKVANVNKEGKEIPGARNKIYTAPDPAPEV